MGRSPVFFIILSSFCEKGKRGTCFLAGIGYNIEKPNGGLYASKTA
jgi:hypothetical protein